MKRLLRGGQYHAVVANPPYIVPRDKQLNDRYRKRFASCHRQYSLAVPFLEQIFRLAVAGGYTGQITSNSFMKREFGKKLIESFFPSVDLTHVIDTAGAYIPGHGTPTVILFGRHRPPMASTLRTVMGIRGEPSTPDDPARGLVWSAIVELIDRPQTTATRDRQGAASDSAPKGQPYVSPGQRPGNVSPEMNQNPEGVALTERGLEPPFQGLPSSGASSPRAMPWADIELPLRDEGEASRSALGARLQSHDQFVSVTDSPRELFHKHPWSIGGGGASELKEQLDEVAEGRLRSVSDEIGFGAVTREDDAYLISSDVCRRHQIAPRFIRPLGAVQFLLPRVVSP